MENVGLGDRHRYVAIGMRRTVIFEVERGPIEVQGLLRREGFGRNGRQRRRREVKIPVLDSLGDQQMLVGVLMGDDGRPFRIQPLVAVRVIEVPMQCRGDRRGGAAPDDEVRRNQDRRAARLTGSAPARL